MDHPFIEKIKTRFLNQHAAERIAQLQQLAGQLEIRKTPFQPQVTHAAVLIPLINHPIEPTLLLTKRTKHLKRHAGQISFPGGICDTSDQDHKSCMQREVEEELGLDRHNIELLGDMGEWPSFSGYWVTVYVGIIQSPLQLTPSKDEVEAVIEVPLSYIFNKANYERVQRHSPTPHHYFQINYQGHLIWGFTGGILRLLAEFFIA